MAFDGVILGKWDCYCGRRTCNAKSVGRETQIFHQFRVKTNMKRKKHINKKPSFFIDIMNKLKERIVSVLAIALVSWVLGIITNYTHTSGIIKELKIDNNDLEWAVDYFRR